LRFFALRLHEAGLIKATPQQIIARGTELIRIEATRSGRFNPVFKEARPGSEGVC
jgi:hypothetical protein